MFYTYVLKQRESDHFYVGSTKDLARRFEEHSAGKTRSTAGRGWDLYCYFAFQEQILAERLELYLKTGSGRGFSKKHFNFKL